MPNLKTPLPPGFPAEAEPTRYRQLLDRIADGSEPEPPCVRRLALPRINSWGPGFAECEMTLGDDVCWTPGVVFGGYVTCLADQFAGLVVLSVLPDDAGFLTAGVEVSFQTPLVPAKVSIRATLIELADRQAVVAVQFKQRRRLCVQASAKQIILRDFATPIKQD